MDKTLLSLRGIRPAMLVIGMLSLLQALAIIGQALSLAEAVTLLFQGGTAAEVLRPLITFVAAWVARHTAVWSQRLCAGRFAERTGETLRSKLAERLFERGPAHAARTGSGRLVTLTLDGVDRFRSYLELTVIRTTDMALVTALLLIAVYALDVASGLILTFTMPVLIGFFVLLGYAARRMADRQYRSFQVLAQHFTDVLRGLATLKFLGRSRDYAGVVEQVSDRYRTATMRTLRVAFLSSFALDFFSTLSVAFVAVGLGLRLISGGIGLEAALAVLLLAPEYFLPVRLFGSDYHASLDGKEAWTAIREVIGETRAPDASVGTSQADGRSDAGRQVEDVPDRQPDHAARSATSAPWLELSDIHVSGEGGMSRLSGITASLGHDHRKIGIVGMSGAGKTTLLNVLGGFLEPESGQVRIAGLPLAGDAKRKWQQELSLIPQRPYLFAASIADNVRFYEPEASDEQVLQALADVGLAELVARLPHGIHERIGDGGRALSGGQAHRIALARALVGRRSVWLLDEPTAHLDVETELELKETMLKLFEGRRVFLATHRLHWMKEMDWIWVLKDGRLAEAGTHEQLLARQGVYRSMMEAAMEEVELGEEDHR